MIVFDLRRSSIQPDQILVDVFPVAIDRTAERLRIEGIVALFGIL